VIYLCGKFNLLNWLWFVHKKSPYLLGLLLGYVVCEPVNYGVPKWTKSQIQYEDKKIYMCCLNLNCALSLNCAHVLSVWVVHIFSRFELCSLSLSCAYVLSCVHMFSQVELCTCSLSLCTTQTERTQLKLREHVHTTQTERTQREHVHNSKLRDNTYIFFVFIAFCPIWPIWHPIVNYCCATLIITPWLSIKLYHDNSLRSTAADFSTKFVQ